MIITNTNIKTLILEVLILISLSMNPQKADYHLNSFTQSVTQYFVMDDRIINPIRQNHTVKPSSEYSKDTVNIKNKIDAFFKALLENDEKSLLKLFTENAVIIPSGTLAKQGLKSIQKYWFTSEDAQKTTITKLKYELEDIKVDLNSALIRATSVQSDYYASGKLRAERKDFNQNYIIYLEKQADKTWLIITLMWTDI